MAKKKPNTKGLRLFWAMMTPEEEKAEKKKRKARMKKVWENYSPEKRKDVVEKMSEGMKKWWASLTPEEEYEFRKRRSEGQSRVRRSKSYNKKHRERILKHVEHMNEIRRKNREERNAKRTED